ncbi:MAG: hypothetical protein HY735_30550 [Verrucomicrobia bacterium]|nr:hypothetical protein [Verrucomicrobiota bacterium]
MKRKAKPRVRMMDPKVLMNYHRWVVENLDAMSRKYPHKFIAVYRNRLLAVGNSHKEVYAVAEKEGIEEPPLTMQVPALDDVEAIL